LLSLLQGDRAVTNGLIVGSLVGIIFYCVAWWSINVVIKNRKTEKYNPILALLAIKIFILKFPLLGIGLWYAFKYIPISPAALIAGIAITQASILIAGVSNLIRK